MQFIQIIESELKKRELTAKKMLSDLGLAPNSMSHWRKGNVPSIEKNRTNSRLFRCYH
jgi:transcriptional regulator with XRE-family HTH domain